VGSEVQLVNVSEYDAAARRLALDIKVCSEATVAVAIDGAK
jgi:hypothetical protein